MTRAQSQTLTPFGRIMHRVVSETPGAIGGAFAASDGEMVDSYSTGDAYEFAVLTAHFGVVLALVKSAFGIFHYGSPNALLTRFARMDIVLCAVEAGYYAVMAIVPAPVATEDPEHLDPCNDAIVRLGDAVRELAKEMA